MKRRLDEAKSVTFNFFGEGTVEMGPSFYNERWEITSAALFVSTTAAEPTARLYVGPVAPQYQIGGTYNGSNDSTDLQITLYAGQRIRCRWGNRGGDGGAIATLSIYGWQIIGE